MDEAERKIARGDQASALLKNELFNDCLAQLEARYIEAWRKSLTVENREDAHRYVTLIGWLKQDLTSIATTGQLERKRLAELEGRKPSPFAGAKDAFRTIYRY